MRAFLLVCLTVLFLSGCSNYHLGTGGQVSFHTLYVAPVVNEAGVPQAVAIVSTQLREAFLHDARVVLVNTPEEADATLNVRLVSYGRKVKTHESFDTGLARNFDVTLNAEATLTDNHSRKPIFENRKAQAVREVFADNQSGIGTSQQLQAEYQTIPLLAETLAKNIRGITLDIW
ncbi:MAG: LptE family protein [Opitutaceae bacterium]|jgi:outer membrane lipopolysaccharide assembly protein LptE/RlpB